MSFRFRAKMNRLSHWLVLLLAILVFISLEGYQPLHEFWDNLGRISQNKALANAMVSTTSFYNKGLSQYTQHSTYINQFNPCRPLAFISLSLVACHDVSKWSSGEIRLSNGNQYLAFFPPETPLLRYHEMVSMVLPASEFENIDSLVLFTTMGNATRSEQGEVIGDMTVVTTGQEVYFVPLRAGIDTAEWAYDFPDVPPKHQKPPITLVLPQGGHAYPLQVEFLRVTSPQAVSVSLTASRLPLHYGIESTLQIVAIARDME